MKIRTQLILMNGLVLSLITIVAIMQSNSINSLLVTSRWVNHTHEVIEKGNTFVKLMVDMETGERGFLIVGKENYLEPYINGKEEFDELMTSTQKLVNDNPAQVKRLKEIAKLAQKWHDKVAMPEIELRRTLNKDASISMVDVIAAMEANQGKVIMDDIREKIAEFISVERDLMTLRTEQNEDTASMATNLSIYTTLAALVILISFALWVIISVTNALKKANNVIKSVANGDLTIEIESENKQ